MSTHTVSPLESTVDKHIDATSRLVRRVDLALSLLIVGALILGGLFIAILADHWLLKEGLSMPLRFGIFVVLATAVGVYIYWKIVPLFRYSISPVYTADLIERDVPTFKNSLINWLLLRQEREEREDVPSDKINDRMFKGIVHTAAGHLQTVPVGHAVDYRKLIYAGTFVTVLLLSFIAYAVFSPKNPLTTIWRVFLPVASIDRPQAAQFRNVDPGDTTVLQGETLTISAEVMSRSTEPVYLVFSTDDGLAVNQRMPMLRPEGKIAFETPFPPGRQGTERGFSSGVDYWIAQGESRSKQYRIDVLPAATVEVVSLRYVFPDYTGLPPEIIEYGGDIRALEGTAVTVTVRSTLPLQEIDLVFDDNPVNHLRMTVDEQKTEAKGTISLKMTSPHRTFAFQATDTNGNASRRSGIYRIEVIPDQPPKVQWADTAENLREVARINLPLNKTLPLPIQAEDPDFALRFLRFKTESPGKRVPDVQLLNSPVTGPTEHRGQINKMVTFSPQEKRLDVGDSAEIWVEAIDTKHPEANISSTRKITIQVIAPTEKEDDPQQDQEQKGNEGEPNQNDTQEQKTDNTNEKDPPQQDQQSGKEQDPNNPEQKAPEQNGNTSEQDPKKNEENPNGKEQDPNNPQPGGQENNSHGASGGGDQPQSGDQPGDSNQGSASNDPSEREGEQTSEGDVNNGQTSKETATQPPSEQSGEGKGGEPAEQQGQQRGTEANLNPETQPGEAMERILDQMREEGKIDENGNRPPNEGARGTETQQGTDSEQRQRSDTLDPNSQNRRDQGRDPSNPRRSTEPSNQQSPNGNQPNQPGEQNHSGTEPGNPAGGEEEGETNPDSGQPNESGNDPGQRGEQGNSDSSQGREQRPGGAPQSEQRTQGGEGGNNQGRQQPGEQGTEEGSPGGPPQGNQQNPTEPQNEGNGTPSKMGGTGGGSGMNTQTTPDDPNLAYAEKVTNLVLEYLEDQLKNGPSEELLDRLGWTEEQLQQFYAKWKDMAAKGQQPQQRENGTDLWKEALKSWGLRPPNPDRPALQRNQTTTQDDRRVTEAQRFPTPPTLLDRFRKYNDGIGRAQ